MAPVRNGRVIFKERPIGYPVPGKTTIYDTTQTIDLNNPPTLNGGVLIKALMFSIDPSIRTRMQGLADVSYVIGESVKAYGIGVVLQSEHASLKAGDHVEGRLDVQEYVVLPPSGISKDGTGPLVKVITNEYGLPWSVFIGVAGMPGKTAYYGYKEYVKGKKGEVIFVTTGAGAVGSLLIQLAKKDGLKVISSAGTDEKVQYLKTLGVDLAFNYKTTETRDVLEKEGPIDIYWDHVGGETLDKALIAAAPLARFIICGMISSYNDDGSAAGIKNLSQTIFKSISIQGHRVFRPGLEPKYIDEFYRIIPKMIEDGEILYREEFPSGGLAKFDEAVLNQQQGKNAGKVVLVVAEFDH